MVGDDIEVTVVDIRGAKVRLRITAPKGISVHRTEVYDAIRRENRAAAQVRPEDVAGLGRIRPGPRRLKPGERIEAAAPVDRRGDIATADGAFALQSRAAPLSSTPSRLERRHVSAGFFERFNELIDRPWAVSLPRTQLLVFMKYLRHADNQTGGCWLRDETIAAWLGHKRANHVQAARRALVEAGLLEIIPTEEAFALGWIQTPYLTATVVRVLVPPEPQAEAPGLFDHLEIKPQTPRTADSRERRAGPGHFAPGQGGPASAPGLRRPERICPSFGVNHSQIGSESVPDRERAYKDERPIEPPMEQEHSHAERVVREAWGKAFADRHGMPYSPEPGDDAWLRQFLAKPAVAWDVIRAKTLIDRLLQTRWHHNLRTLCEAINGLVRAEVPNDRRTDDAPRRLTGLDRIRHALNTPDPVEEMLSRAGGAA